MAAGGCLARFRVGSCPTLSLTSGHCAVSSVTNVARLSVCALSCRVPRTAGSIIPKSRLAAGRESEDTNMLETIAVVLLILWALGLVSSYIMGGFIHILLDVALVIIVIRVIQRRRL